MRQLKALMKAKKPMRRCGECKCITLQCWRENDEFCNCGDNIEYTPGREDTVSDTYIKFESASGGNSVDAILKVDPFEVSISASISIEIDAGTGDPIFRIDDVSFLDDNSYTNEYILEAFRNMINSLDITCVEKLMNEEPTLDIVTPSKLKTERQINNFINSVSDVITNYCTTQTP